MIPGRVSAWLAACGALLIALAMLPPVGTLAGHYESVEALQFSIFAVVAPALVVMGAPWRALRLSPSALDRLAAGRRRHPEMVRCLGFLGVDLAVIVLWRTPVAVDALSGRRWLVGIEAASLVAVGIVLWLELVESAPLVPRSPYPRRSALAAVAMWTIWAIAYVEAMSTAPWYRAFHHVAGSGLSASADRQLSTLIVWAVTAGAFMPVIFWNLVQWLRNEEDPDDELYRLLREERQRSTGAL